MKDKFFTKKQQIDSNVSRRMFSGKDDLSLNWLKDNTKLGHSNVTKDNWKHHLLSITHKAKQKICPNCGTLIYPAIYLKPGGVVRYKPKAELHYCSISCSTTYNQNIKEVAKRQSRTKLKEASDKIYDVDYLYNELHINKQMPCNHIAEELNVSPTTIQNIFYSNNLKIIRYPGCNQSKAELEIIEFIKEHYNGEIKLSSSPFSDSNQHLDIYLPELNLAIEHNGLYFHSEFDKSNCKGTPRRYHINKTIMAEKEGILLLQVFSNEWKEKKDIIKSIILSKLNKCKTIYARKCHIKELTPKKYKEFLKNNHRQGPKNSRVKLGLYHRNELVSVMGLSKRHKKYDWELDRFCNKLNFTVTGGQSKLLSYFRKRHKGSIVSYCDRRYSNGNSYFKNGFKLSHMSRLGCHFVTNNYSKLESRMVYQSAKLKNVLLDYDNNKSVDENLIANGIDRIWDCGNYVFVME